METVNILGLKIAKTDMAGAVDFTLERLEAGKKTAVYTPNPEIIWLATKDRELFRVLSEGDMLLPDGIGVVIASGIIKNPLPERVAGFDFAGRLFALSAERGYRVFLLGSKPGIAEAAAENLALTYPGVCICGTHHGYFREEEKGEVIKAINDSRADILLVCLGVGQEKWISDNKDDLCARVYLGAGGSLDVLAGEVKRAPRWMQKTGLEWLYRVIRQPERIPRLAALPKFLFKVLFTKGD